LLSKAGLERLKELVGERMSVIVCRTLAWRLLASSFLILSLGLPAPAQKATSSGTTPFVLDGNRIYAEVSFVLPDGSLRNTRAFVDLGSPSMLLSPALYKELQLDQRKSLTLLIGGLPLNINSSEAASVDGWFPFSVGSDPQVEALLPAGLMQKYQIVIDYRLRTLTFAPSGSLAPEGIAVPFRINEKTGLIAVEASIADHPYSITIDCGSGYTWLRKSAAEEWLRAHPDWIRGLGAAGPSNMRMADDGVEAAGALLRIAEIKVGALTLRQVGALAIGPDNKNWDFIDWYSKKNVGPVIGWFGGNVLEGFRLTIDYANRTIYWLAEADLDPHDLDQVGLTLQYKSGEYFVAGVVRQHGKPTVDSVLPGDRLIQIDGFDASGAPRGSVFSALHGKPGQIRTLTLERNGRQLTVQAKVSSF
jgi:hypothetical protein